MKREFLENLKIGETPLTKEIVDAIMDENGRDIEAAKKPFADYEAVKEQLQAAKDGLKAFAGVDVGQLQGEVAKLRGELAEKDQAWQAKLDAAAFEGRVKDAITAARGRNPKAVAALLDLDAGGDVQRFHTANVLRRIVKYMPYRTGATIRLTQAQSPVGRPYIVTDAPYARYLYYGKAMDGKAPRTVTDRDLVYTKTRNPLAGPKWGERLAG